MVVIYNKMIALYMRYIYQFKKMFVRYRFTGIFIAKIRTPVTTLQ